VSIADTATPMDGLLTLRHAAIKSLPLVVAVVTRITVVSARPSSLVIIILSIPSLPTRRHCSLYRIVVPLMWRHVLKIEHLENVLLSPHLFYIVWQGINAYPAPLGLSLRQTDVRQPPEPLALAQVPHGAIKVTRARHVQERVGVLFRLVAPQVEPAHQTVIDNVLGRPQQSKVDGRVVKPPSLARPFLLVVVGGFLEVRNLIAKNG
jgi:hypothetical protein